MRHLFPIVMTLVVALAPGCQRRPSLTGEDGETSDEATSATAPNAQRSQASHRPPAGASCGGRDDCPSDQICVQEHCSYRLTSVAGEVLASSAAAQARAGDWRGAIETYGQAFEAFEEADAPAPPEVACGAASLMLRTATDAEGREAGAQRADLCFRTTVPSHPLRESVRVALSLLRYEGLDMANFDADTPAEQFFTNDPGRPTVDIVQIEFDMPDLEPNELSSHTAVREILEGEDARNTVADCFLQDWEFRHERTATADLNFGYTTTLRDMGSYDVYRSAVTIEATTAAVDGFEPCLVSALARVFEPGNRSIRGEAWNQPVTISAHIQ